MEKSDNTRYIGNLGIYKGVGEVGVVDFPPHNFSVVEPLEPVVEDFADMVRTVPRVVTDSTGMWFEFGWVVPAELQSILVGNSSAGWEDVNARVKIEIQQTENFLDWNSGRFVPCAVPSEDNGDGSVTYWSRCVTPAHWEEIMLNLSSESDRYGKSVTGISCLSVDISLPRYPYAMPAQAAELQEDLRLHGFTGAIVKTVPGPLTATGRNHTMDGAAVFHFTQEGSSVTSVMAGGVEQVLSYPYAMESIGELARLQADLRSAGQSGAVIMLHADTWSIVIPDLLTTAKNRGFVVSVTPGDPFPVWNFYKEYVGLNPADTVVGMSYDVRNPSGGNLLELKSQFARLRITPLS